MTSNNPHSSDFNYKKYSLQHLEEWIHDSLNCEDITPQEVYNAITNAVDENIEYHKRYLTKNIELLSLLKGNRSVNLEIPQDYSYDLTATGEKMPAHSKYYYDYDRNDPTRTNPFEIPDYTEL